MPKHWRKRTFRVRSSDLKAFGFWCVVSLVLLGVVEIVRYFTEMP